MVTPDPIEGLQRLGSHPDTGETGAIVHFSGLVRGTEEGERIGGIHYEAFEAMVRRQFGLILDEIETKWPITGVRVTHRVGWVRVGEASIWVEVQASHRAEAFAAAQFLVDEMKKRVPIWKKPG